MLNTSSSLDIAFALTALATAGVFLYTVWRYVPTSLISRLLLIILPVWIAVQGVIAANGFYWNTTTLPPRLFLTGVLPALSLIAIIFVFFRPSLLEHLPIRVLTLIHLVRIPVELVLWQLSRSGDVPEIMTFEGWNFDILAGLLAPLVYLIAFRDGRIRRGVLLVYNLIGILLLANIVSIAILSLPSPIEQFAFQRPNRAVLYFPYVWLPSVVVPIVLFSHLSALWKLSAQKLN
jgi:hypothetical protein